MRYSLHFPPFFSLQVSLYCKYAEAPNVSIWKKVNMSTCADKISWAQATSHKCVVRSDHI